MKHQQAEKAHAEWPLTEPTEDGRGVRITGFHKTPRRTAFMHGLAAVIFCIGMVFAVIAGFSAGSWGTFFLCGAVALGLGLIVEQGFPAFFARNLAIEIYPERIELGRRKYSRAEPIEFRVEPHHKALQEARAEENMGQRTARTYRHAIEVVMQYGEKRVVIAEMPEKDLEKAKALVIRLQNICDQCDAALKQLLEGRKSEPAPARGDFGPAPEIR